MFWGCSLVCGAHLPFASCLFFSLLLHSFLCSYFCLSISPDNLIFFLFKWRKIYSLYYLKSFLPSSHLLPSHSPSSPQRTHTYPQICLSFQKPTKDIMKQRKMYCCTKRTEDRWWGAGSVGTKTERIMKTRNDADQEKLERNLCAMGPCLWHYFFICCTLILLFMKDGDANYSCPTGRRGAKLSESRKMCDWDLYQWLNDMHLQNCG